MASRQRRRAQGRAGEAPRERVGHEAPGVVMHGPPLTLTCACGRKQQLSYGESWACENCGKTWDTSAIPKAEYAQIRRIQLRFRALPVALGLVVVGLAAFLTLSGSASGVVLLLPIALLSWYMMRGVHRRRYQAAIARRRSWTLRGGQSDL